MRITHNMLSLRMVTDLREAYSDLARSQREVSSGRRIHRPSDDPLATHQALAQRAALDGLAAHRDGITSATTWLNSGDSSLQRVHDLLHRARELTVQAANGTHDQTNRDAIALEIDHLIDAAKEAVGVRLGEAYIFSGTATTTKPYAAGSDTYAGDTGTVVREVGPGVAIQVGVRASDILGSGQAAADGLVIDTLRDIAEHLRGGTAADIAALRGADLQALDANTSLVSNARATLGAAQNRVDAAAARLADLEELGVTNLSELEDADLARSLASMHSQQTAYQAALKAGSTLIQPSLMDFLR